MTTQPLWTLKEWLTLEDTAHHLSTEFGERITAADILRFGIKGDLKLSCNFVNATPAVFGHVASIGTRKAVFFPAWGGQARAVWLSPGGGRRPVLDQPLELGEEVTRVHGVWDLLMIEDTPRAVEDLYQRLTGGPEVWPTVGDGILVTSTEGKLARPLLKGERRDPRRLHIDNYILAHDLPTDGVLVVRAAALMEFKQQRRAQHQHDLPVENVSEKNEPHRESGKTLTERERQGREIIRVIREHGHDPNALPKHPSGRKGIKAQVRARLDFTKASFDHTWKWLRETGAIEDER